jgi:DNA-nicking Smr family endonuclease
MSSDRRKNEASDSKGVDEDADWLNAISDVEQMDGETSGPDIVDSEPTTGLAERFRQRQPVEPTLTEDPGLSIDGHSMERIRRGKMPIEAQVDLHGCTQEEALLAVNEFLEESWNGRRRLVLLITGKGTARDGGGVLRSAVPRWITEGRFRSCLVGISAADRRHGGDGAVYVMLRKQ